MKKKVSPKAKHARQKRKSLKHYLFMYSLAVLSGLTVYLVGNPLTQQTLPCANTKTCQTGLKEQIDNNATALFQGQTFTPPKIDFNERDYRSVLGVTAPTGEKHIYIDLATQKLYAYQGPEKVMETYISSGKWNPTPVGNYAVWLRFRSTRMSGGEGADYYNLPNVPYTMYFYGDYGIHGAYWHNNFGHRMSHGCVNMRIVDARDLYNWADGPTQGKKGTPVSVCYSFIGPNNCVQEKQKL